MPAWKNDWKVHNAMDGDDQNISQLKFLIVHTSFSFNHDLIIASDLTKTKIIWQPNNKLVIKWL